MTFHFKMDDEACKNFHEELVYRHYSPCTRCGNVHLKPTLKGTTKIHCTISRRGQRHQWPLNGVNIEISTNCFSMHWNLTREVCLHVFTMWEAFLTQRWLTHPIVLYIIDDMQMGKTLRVFSICACMDWNLSWLEWTHVMMA